MTVTNTTPPTITGTAKQGLQLSASAGQWTYDLDYLTYDYQWLRCDTNGDNCVSIANATSAAYAVAAADIGARLRAQVTATEHANVPPDPDPPEDLPFAEANLRVGYNTITVPLNTQQITAPQGADCLIDLEGLKRTVGSLLIYGYSGQRIHVIDGYWEGTRAIDGSPYWRGGPRVRAADSTGPEHVSLTGMLTTGSTVPDGIAIAAGINTKVTVQRWRHESRFAFNGGDTAEPAEHCDALQVQGLIGELEVGLATVYCQNVAPPNEGGKCFQLKNEGGNNGFPVTLNQVNMRGGGRTGTFLLQTTRDIPVTLTDVYAQDDGITTGSNWNWSTSGGGMFYPNSSAGSIGWTRSGASGSYVADWPDSAAVYGTIKQGLPPTGDYVTRAMLGH